VGRTGSTLTAHVSAAFVKRLVAQAGEDAEPLVERIVRADVRGISRTSSTVDAELIEDPDRILIDLVIRGTTVSDSIGRQGPVKIDTTSHTPFVARKRMSIGASGATGAVPTVDLYGVLCLNRLTNRADRVNFPLAGVAGRIYRRSSAEAIRQIEDNTRSQVHERIERESAPHLKNVELACSAVFDLLKDLGRPQLEMRFSSSAASANVAVAMCERQEGEVVVSPPPLPASWDLAFRVHENMIGRLAQTALAGKTCRLDHLESLGDDLLDWLQGRIAPDSTRRPDKNGPRIPEDKAPEDQITITFAREDPVRIQFADRHIKVIMQAANYHAGGQDYQGFSVQLPYKLAAENCHLTAIREGPAVIEAVGVPGPQRKKLPRSELAFLRQAFETGTERLAIPELNLPTPGNQPGVLTPTTLKADGGWLVLAWRWK
jgi:hypothetical protein